MRREGDVESRPLRDLNHVYYTDMAAAMVLLMQTCSEGMLIAWARLLALQEKERERESPFFSSSFIIMMISYGDRTE